MQDYIDYIEIARSKVVDAEKNRKLQDIIKKLHDENKKLKDDYHQKGIDEQTEIDEWHSEWTKKSDEDRDEYRALVQELKEENKKLKDDYHQKGIDEQTEIDEWHSEWTKKSDEDRDEYRALVQELKEENKIQKQIIRETKRQMGYSVSDTEEEDEEDSD